MRAEKMEKHRVAGGGRNDQLAARRGRDMESETQGSESREVAPAAHGDFESEQPDLISEDFAGELRDESAMTHADMLQAERPEHR